MPAAEVSFSKRTFGKGRSALPEARHQLDEVAGFVAAVELVFEDTVPHVLHRSGPAGQRKDIRAARDTGARPRPHRRGADCMKTQQPEQLAATRDTHLRAPAGIGNTAVREKVGAAGM